jgi:ABC-type uncharacterized transport system substrate-binding protein
MRRRDLLTVAAIAAAIRLPEGHAGPAKVPVVGVLVVGKPDPAPILRAFREELRKLGYVEGRNIRLEVRSADGKLERLPELAAELARRKVDVAAAWMTPAVLAAQREMNDTPIVMIGAADPVGMGIVTNLAHPGGNITGIAGMVPELTAKLVELLRETMPRLRRIAALCNSADPFSHPFLAQVESAGNAEKIAVAAIQVAAGPQLDAAFPAMAGARTEAVVVQPSLPLAHIAELALRYRIPAVSPLWEFPQLGGLMAYSNALDVRREAAVFVDKILRGAKPADLPVEQPTRFRLIINLKTAKVLGLTIPRPILSRADEIIE